MKCLIGDMFIMEHDGSDDEFNDDEGEHDFK
jgi:hypothetical protein